MVSRFVRLSVGVFFMCGFLCRLWWMVLLWCVIFVLVSRCLLILVFGYCCRMICG